MEQGAALFGKATFAMNRGYGDNKMFLKMEELGQDYVIRLKSNRKLLYHNKWTPATELRNRRKGKVKANVFYKGKNHEAYLSHVKVQITASRKDIYLVLVYGITEHPMMLATNKKIKSKEEVIRVARIYFSRWKIEEYFRCKKQMFQFENFRVRKLHAIYSHFDDMVQDKTSIYISHRMSSCRFCDDILVFDKGMLVQRGNHDLLMKQQGQPYTKLWNAQAKYYEDSIVEGL